MFWVMKFLHCRAILCHEWQFLVIKGHYGAVLGHFGTLKDLCKGPRVVQYDTISCSIPMGSVLGTFGFMTGHFWCYFGPLWGPCWPPKRAQGGPTWHIIMLYSHLKWFRVIWGHAVPFWAILVIISHSDPNEIFKVLHILNRLVETLSER